jgi:hypothetical protein
MKKCGLIRALVPTLRVGMPSSTLRVGLFPGPEEAAERPGRHSHAERGNERNEGLGSKTDAMTRDDLENPYTAPRARLSAPHEEWSRLALISWLVPFLLLATAFSWLIMPKIELYWRERGDPPFWVTPLVVICHFYNNYLLVNLILIFFVFHKITRHKPRANRTSP